MNLTVNHEWFAVEATLPSTKKTLRVGCLHPLCNNGLIPFLETLIDETKADIEWFVVEPALAKKAHYIIPDHQHFALWLAEQHLDIAIYPLCEETNPSNFSELVPILQYSALGIPVICTVLEKHHHLNLPVIALPNRQEEWVSVLRSALEHPDEFKNVGQHAKIFVKENFV